MNGTELEASRVRYFDLYELAPVGYLTLSATGHILDVNRSAAIMLGVERDNLLHQLFSLFISADDHSLVFPDPSGLELLDPSVPHQAEVRMIRPDGSVFWAHLVATSLAQINDLPVRLVVLSDINGHKQMEEILRESEERHRLLFESATDALFLITPDTGRIIKANTRASELYGYEPEALSGRRSGDLFADPAEAERLIEEAQAVPETIVCVPLCTHRRHNGTRFAVELTGRTIPMDGQQVVFMTARDISRRTQVEAILEARLRLLQRSGNHSRAELLQATIDEAETLTGSQIGFYHFLEADQVTISLQAWSTNTLNNMCSAEGSGRHYSVSEAGVWVDCLRERRPVIHNDYASLSHRRGLPPGHAPVVRELVVPVMRGDALVALLGVGNKPAAYTDQDVEAVTALADFAWDIAERKRAEEALRESEERRKRAREKANARLREQTENLQSIYNALESVGLIIVDLGDGDCCIKNFNVGAEKLFGWGQDEALGQSISMIYPPELIGIIPGRVEKLRRGEAMNSFDMVLMRRSGERFPAVISVHPFDQREGSYRKAVGSFRDISELHQARMELEAINEDLERRVEQRTKELQETHRQYLHAEKLSAIGKLSASIAHEFNNPLQGILSILKGLKKRAILEPEDRDLLDSAIVESDRIKELIRSLQDFNRPSSGRKILLDVRQSLDSMLLLHKSDFKNKRITVRREYAADLPQIMAVPDQIKQVFLNLLTNAADACQQPGGEITVSTHMEGDRVAVSIRDTGIGIQPEEMERIFQPFYTTKQAVKGTGLGLSVSYGIVKHHGGEIRVTSEPGMGSTFTVMLPVQSEANGSSKNDVN